MVILKCQKDNLDRAFASDCSAIGGDDELFESMKLKYDQMLTNFNYQAINHCLESYIISELDSETSGERGLGRMTSFIPRLGAYFRNELSQLSESNKIDLYDLIQDLVLRGYLVHVLFMETDKREVEKSSGTELYESWIPEIYSGNPSEMGENLQKILSACSESAYESLYAFINEHRIDRDEIFQSDETDSIFTYYLLSGFGLRLLEIND